MAGPSAHSTVTLPTWRSQAKPKRPADREPASRPANTVCRPDGPADRGSAAVQCQSLMRTIHDCVTNGDQSSMSSLLLLLLGTPAVCTGRLLASRLYRLRSHQPDMEREGEDCTHSPAPFPCIHFLLTPRNRVLPVPRTTHACVLLFPACRYPVITAKQLASR